MQVSFFAAVPDLSERDLIASGKWVCSDGAGLGFIVRGLAGADFVYAHSALSFPTLEVQLLDAQESHRIGSAPTTA